MDGSDQLVAPTPRKQSRSTAEDRNGNLGEENQMEPISDSVLVTNTVQIPLSRTHDSLSTINEDPLEVKASTVVTVVDRSL